jgi:DNA-directed RNA polymerase-4 subunit 1
MNFSTDPKLHIIDGGFWLQDSTSGLSYAMFKQYGVKNLEFLSSAQDILCEFLTMKGLSVSLPDVYLFSDH